MWCVKSELMQAQKDEDERITLPNMAKLYDDVIDYLSVRSEFKAKSLGEENLRARSSTQRTFGAEQKV